MTDLSREDLTRPQKFVIMMAQQFLLSLFQVVFGGYCLMILAGVAHHDIIPALVPFGYTTSMTVMVLALALINFARYRVDTRELFE